MEKSIDTIKKKFKELEEENERLRTENQVLKQCIGAVGAKLDEAKKIVEEDK